MKAQHLHEAMMNSFNLITNRMTYNDLFKKERSFLVHIPDEPVTDEDLEMMIVYFEHMEMYEECAELKAILDEIEEEEEEDDSCACKNPTIYDDEDGDIKCKICNKKLSWWR